MVKQGVLLPFQLEVEEMTGNREIAVLKRDKGQTTCLILPM